MKSTMSSDFRDLKTLIGRYLAPYWKQLVGLVGLSFLAATLNSITPLLLAPAMDIGAGTVVAPAQSLATLSLNNLGATLLSWQGAAPGPGRAWQVMWVTAVLFIIAGMAAALIEFSAYMLSAWISTRAYRDLQVALHRHLMGQELGYFLRSRVGELTSRFVTDAGEAMTALDFSVRTALQAALEIAIYGFLLAKTSLFLAGATVLVSIAHLGVNRLIGRRLRRSTATRLDSLGGVSSVLQEGFTTIRVIKSFGAEAHEHSRFVRVANLVRKTTLEFSIYKNGETPLRRITDIVAIGSMLLLAFSAMQAGQLTFQGFVLFMVVVRLTIAPISSLAQALTRLQGGLGSARRVLEFLAREPVVADGPRADAAFNKAIRLEGVSFGYSPETLVFTEVDLELRKGELLAIVGASGAGKSTLVDLMLRLYDPLSGCVTIDGVDVRLFNQSAYRRLFGVVSQESLLFNESIADNITFGRATGRQADLERAAEIANAADFIMALPEGYDTFVGDRGVRLSGGQRQRIAIARAIYSSPPILILDEATSALDSDSERLVQQAIDRVLTSATAVVIAHRLSTILHADRIVVLDNGRIEAVDTHEALLATNRTYRRLHDLQFKSATHLSST